MKTMERSREIRRIQLYARKHVSGLFAGMYESLARGRGLTFASVRPYVFGDDVRTIDWKVTARVGTPHIKEFVEERERTVIIALDGSRSLFFGTQARTKRETAAELAAILAYCAALANDRAGLLLFTDRVEKLIPAAKGRNHIARVIHEILTFAPRHHGTDLGSVLRTLERTTPRHSVIFLVSDFQQPLNTYEQALLRLAVHQHLVVVRIQDFRETTLPSVGLVRFQDAETDQTTWVDTSSRQWAQQFQQEVAAQRQAVDALLTRAGVDRVDLESTSDVASALLQAFQQFRERSRR
jgi:uncharacterized protein (DUF58 family)